MATWTIITDGSIDEDSPLTTTLFTNFRGNIEYNFERAARGGTHATGVRLVIARGTKTLAAAAGTQIGTSGLYWSNITATAIAFDATDSADGDPNFLAATTPIILLSCVEDDSGGKLNWDAGGVVAGPYVASGSLSDTGFTIECEFLATSNSAGIGAIFQWVAIGLPSTGE